MTYIETFSQFIEWIARFNDGQYLFRGVSKECYKIEASACRRLPTGSDDPSKLLDINKRLIDDARTLGHDLKDGRELSDLDLLAELQHCGAATCLIDFTHSALIALWFACQQSTEGAANGKVSAVRVDEPGRFKRVTPELVTEKGIDYFFTPDEYQLYKWQPKLQNNRIIAQQSIFLFGGSPIVPVAECAILRDFKQNLLTSLNQSSGITEASMFPDFDGFARLHTHKKLDVEPDAQGNLQRGIEAYERGDMAGAINYYDKAMELNPDYADAYYYRGRAYYDNNNDADAIEDFNNAIELNPDYADAYHYRGQALYRSGEIDLATTDLTEAQRLRTLGQENSTEPQ